MKISKLLVLSALWLIGQSVSAADLIERTEPTNEDVKEVPVAFEVGKTYLLYNTTAQMYFTQGSNWSTRGCVVPNKISAVRIKVAKYTLADVEWDGKTYEIQNYVTNRTSYSWYKASMNDAGDLYLDQTTWANRFYEIQDQGNNVYRLMPNEVNADVKSDGSQFVGRDDNIPYDSSNDTAGFEDADQRVPLSALLTEGEGHHIDWVFYDASIYDAYEKSKTLKSVIETAEAQGADVNAAVNVYNNLDATVEQIEAAITTLQEAMNSGISNGTAENPTNATSLITNPNFDGASAAGWSGSNPGWGASGQSVASVAEFYQGSNVNFYQDISGMPEGVYCVTMDGFYRSGNAQPCYDNFLAGTNYLAKLYASVGEDELTVDMVNPFEIMNTESFATSTTEWGAAASESTVNNFRIPNDPSCARIYFGQGWYKNILFFSVGGDGVARIGLKKDGNYIGGDWILFDNFTLTYYGNTQASFQKWVELSAPDYSNAVVTASLLSSYQSTVSSLAASATDRTSAAAAVEQINELVKQIKQNMSLWAQYLAKVQEATNFISTSDFAPYAGELAEYLGWDAEDYINNRDLDSDGLKAEMEHIDQMIEAVKEAAAKDVHEGDDVTKRYLTNADFEAGNAGWQGASSITAFNAGCAEAYEKNPFDLYQTVEGAKAGVYQITLQGFYRTGSNDAAYSAYKAAKASGTPIPPVAWVYLNDNKTPLNNVFDIEGEITSNDFFVSPLVGPAAYAGTADDGNTYYFPNGMSTSHDCFEAGYYTKGAMGLVAEDGGALRIGITGNLGGSQWAIWDNFKLVYLGYQADAIREPLSEAIASVDLSKVMGKSIKAEAATVIAEAQSALAGSDGTAMFNALKSIFALKTKIDESVALFASLYAEIQGLQLALSNTDADETVQAEVGAILESMQNGYMKNEFDDADVPNLLARIAEALAMLNMPSDIMSASDANPVTATKLIQSASYSEEVQGDEGIIETNQDKGWQGESGSFGNDDTQKAALLYEFYNKTFDHYQIIGGMPAGAWEIKVFAFARFGGYDVDYQSYLDGATNNTFLYTEVGGVRRQVALPFLFAGADNFDSGVEGAATLNVDANGAVVASADEAAMTYWMPGSMVTARAFFDQYKYENTITVVVPDEGNGKGTLRFGIYKPTKNEDFDWVIMDDWSLTFYGASSTKQNTGTVVNPEGIETASAAAKAVKTEFFTLDGRKAGAAQKGIVIVRQTMNNGNVVVRKIQK